jgi:hypothetical protein
LADHFAFAFEHEGRSYRGYREPGSDSEITWRVMRGPSLESEDEWIADFTLPLDAGEDGGASELLVIGGRMPSWRP